MTRTYFAGGKGRMMLRSTPGRIPDPDGRHAVSAIKGRTDVLTPVEAFEKRMFGLTISILQAAYELQAPLDRTLKVAWPLVMANPITSVFFAWIKRKNRHNSGRSSCRKICSNLALVGAKTPTLGRRSASVPDRCSAFTSSPNVTYPIA